MSGPIALDVGMSNAANTSRPEAGDQMKALEVPTYQLRGELRIRLFERGEVAFLHERALGKPTKIDPTQADVDSGQPWSAGMAVRYSIAPHGQPWSVGLGVELMRWSIPYIEYRTCVENCEGVDDFQEDHGQTGEMTFGVGITPAYRVGRFTIFGGVHMRNHPTINRKGTEYTEYNDEDLEAGPPNWMLNAGVAVKLGAFTALALVHQDLDTDPVRYGPGIGVAISAAFDPARLPPPPGTGDREPATPRSYAPPGETPPRPTAEPTYESQF